MNGLWYGLITLSSCAFRGGTRSRANPHQPRTYTWEIVNQAGDLTNSSSVVTTTTPWYDLEVDLCRLALGADAAWGTPDHYLPQQKPVNTQQRYSTVPGCYNAAARTYLTMAPIYVCPGSHRDHSLTTRCAMPQTTIVPFGDVRQLGILTGTHPPVGTILQSRRRTPPPNNLIQDLHPLTRTVLIIGIIP